MYVYSHGWIVFKGITVVDEKPDSIRKEAGDECLPDASSLLLFQLLWTMPWKTEPFAEFRLPVQWYWNCLSSLWASSNITIPLLRRTWPTSWPVNAAERPISGRHTRKSSSWARQWWHPQGHHMYQHFPQKITRKLMGYAHQEINVLQQPPGVRSRLARRPRTIGLRLSLLYRRRPQHRFGRVQTNDSGTTKCMTRKWHLELSMCAFIPLFYDIGSYKWRFCRLIAIWATRAIDPFMEIGLLSLNG